jgi:Fusaric acid resistance protein family
MASRVTEPAWSVTRPMADPLSVDSPNVLLAAGPPLLFGLRLWASVCLALYVAFWLQLDNPYWAGTSAAVVCQPQLGASLRKGWFRMIGTLVGATMIVALTACFPQDHFGFLGLLALWGSFCAFAATVLRNFASYAAALAGYAKCQSRTDLSRVWPVGSGDGAGACEVGAVEIAGGRPLSRMRSRSQRNARVYPKNGVGFTPIPP